MEQISYVNTLQIQYLSDEDLDDSLDPLGVGRVWFHQHFSKEVCLERVSPLFAQDPQDIVHEYVSHFLSDKELNSKHRPIVEYERELETKCGRQGGKVPWPVASKLFAQYFVLPRRTRFRKVAEVGLKTWLRRIGAKLRRVAPPNTQRDLFLQNTAFGLPYGGSKSNEYSHKQVPLSGWWHPYPCLPNTRFMRSKLRCVFCSSGLDCDAIGPDLTSVRNWLKEYFPHEFGAWREPHEYTYRDIATGVIRNKWFLETDFKAMDTHFTWRIVQKLILPIYQLLLAPADYLHFAAFIEEAFRQPLLCGNELWTGEHSLFSGLPFTNDFETLYDAIIYMGAHVLCGQPVDTFGYCFKAIGDDVVYYGSKEVVLTVYDLVRDEFAANGVILSEEKTRIQQGECRFCRHVYYPGCRRELNKDGYEIIIPAYPMILSINNSIQPESTADSRTNELLSDFQRWDNGDGHYAFDNIVNWIISKMRPEVVRPLAAGAEQAFEHLQLKDWWFKVYGTTYTLGQSRAAKIFQARAA